MKITRYISL